MFLNSIFAKESFPENLIAKTIKEYQADQEVPGVAVVLYYKGQPYFYAFGLADIRRGRRITAQTIFELGSITKSFTAILLASESLKGVLKLNDTAKNYLPGFSHFEGPFANVTLYQLATHTSGLPRHLPYKDRLNYVKLVQFLKKWQPNQMIGTSYDYSNLGFGLLAICIEKASEKKYMDLLQEDLLMPLGMEQTFLRVPLAEMKNYAQGYNKEGKKAEEWPITLLFGAGALRSSAQDMGKFLAACLNLPGTPKEVHQAIKLTQREGFKLNNNKASVLSWIKRSYDSYTLYTKNGGVSGFSTFMGFIPELKTGIVILANKKANNTAVGRNILQTLASKALE